MGEQTETTKEYIDRYRVKYKNLRPMYCPALKENVFFTSEGFNHLLFKRGHKRSVKEIKYRLPLINLICPAIKRCKTVNKTQNTIEEYKSKEVSVCYFELNALVGIQSPAVIKVILKRRGKTGILMFQSVMKQKAPKNRCSL